MLSVIVTVTDVSNVPPFGLKTGVATATVVALPSITETVLERLLATTRSGAPSPLTSPTATEAGVSPVPKFSADRNVPSPLPGSTVTTVES